MGIPIRGRPSVPIAKVLLFFKFIVMWIHGEVMFYQRFPTNFDDIKRFPTDVWLKNRVSTDFLKKASFFESFDSPEASLQPRGATLCFFRPTYQQMSVSMFETQPNFVEPFEFPLECPCQLINSHSKVHICSNCFSFFAISPEGVARNPVGDIAILRMKLCAKIT